MPPGTWLGPVKFIGIHR